MNLQDVIKSTKQYFQWSDAELSRFMGISRSQITKIHNGYWEGLSCDVIKRISQLFNVSIDELLDNKFLPPTYHIANHTHATYIVASCDYPDFSIQKDDFLYIRPFTHEEERLGTLVVYNKDDVYHVKRYESSDQALLILYYIVGISRSYHKPDSFNSWQTHLDDQVERRGAPIKL